jgi:hypothetical protein
MPKKKEHVVCAVSGKKYFMRGIHYYPIGGGKRVNGYTTTYTSIGGPKAVLLSIDKECGGHYTPWNTWYAAKNMDAAKEDAKSWAESEDCPCFV